ncbi:Peroxisomal biogenesis factor 6 AltName: Full=ClaPEX6 [Rhizoctonia solani AG-1 IB]|uniref:Peroxisomal ATPase PEX6 n=1 Tax=Thanatephorus cucumeris (strain AG1-IB / isolate 7/3/14) TaxID=1108050 RepID=M5CF64_THACB|nr:Peroxisomal biogenesis factor 6 AltName: Full=ClaPEX6 [Rhizoctonia solani AG-1 IB]
MRAHVLGLSEVDVELSKDIWDKLFPESKRRASVVTLGRVEWARLNEDLGAGSCLLPFNTPSTNVDIVPTTPIPLSTVFVSAQAYAQSPDTYYEHILREGELSVLATEPVLQGISVRDYTQFVLVPTTGSESDSQSTSTSDVSESIPTSESDALEIDEDFLRGWDSTAHSPLALTPVPTRGIDGHSVNVSTYDLAKLGMLSGDWAILSPGESHADRARLVQVNAKDETTRSTIQVSPVLLFNTIPPAYTSKSIDSNEPPSNKLFLRPTSYSSAAPPVPLARSITLARVASKSANDKRLADRVVRALRETLQGAADNQNKRPPLLLKLNDLIAIHIDGSEPDAEDYDAEEEESQGDAQKAIPEVELDVEPPSVRSSSTEEGVDESTPIFLKVVNIDYAPTSLTNGSSDHSGDRNPSPDRTTTAIAFGELGCSINPGSTRVSMVGVEHGLVPCMAPYEEDDEDGDVESVLTPLLRATLLPNAAHYGIALSALVRGARGSGKARSVRRSAEKIGVGINAYTLIADTEAKTEGLVRVRFEQAALCAPCVFLIRHIEALVRPGQGGKEPAMAAVLAECIRGLGAAWGSTGYPVAVVATTAEPDAIPVGVMACFRHEIVLEAPDERRRLRMLNTIVAGQKLPLAADVELSAVARETAALHAGDLVHLVRGARDQALKRVLKELSDIKSKPDSSIPIPTTRDLALAVIPITARDFELALDGARAAYSESIGAPKIPNVSWDDVGGLAHVKGEILDTIQLPLEHPELFADGMKKRSGILLYGPPGTGKTLLAKAVATSCALNFLSVKGPELLNMYIGESEANVRRVFQRARDARPCVVFFDELDSIAPRRGQAGDSGGVMDRIVSQILAELDGMGAGGNGGEVFVIGATNRPDLLDPALLRPGRFDRMLYLGVSKTHEDQLRILQALTRKFKLDPSLELAAVAERCPFNYTGADFYALCSDAMLKSMARKAEEIERRVAEINAAPPLPEHSYPMTAQYYLAELATPTETDVLVDQGDFERALAELVPSVSASELEHYREVQQKFASSTINSIEKEDSGDGADDEQEVDLPKLDKGKGKAA